MKFELNTVQFEILDALYFVEPLDKILEEVEAPKPVIIAELRFLISQRFVQALVFDETAKDFVKTAFYDADHMEEYRYLATKEGLLHHSGMR
jgi:hypothetical protein